MLPFRATLASLAVLCLGLGGRLSAQADSAKGPRAQPDLAQTLTNPISDIVSVPFQFNWENGVGPGEDTRFILNVQPVVPFTLNKRLNLVARVIVPLVSQPPLVEGAAPTFGVGDILGQFFFVPTSSSKLIWGVGPIVNLPSTADPFLGSGKWAAGPVGVVLRMAGPWTFGALGFQIWSFAGSRDRSDVNQMFLQPFLAHTSKSGVTVTLQSETLANWEAESGQQWTVPINLIVTKLSKFGPFPAQYGVGAGVFVAAPDGGPEWKLRTQFTLVLPRTK